MPGRVREAWRDALVLAVVCGAMVVARGVFRTAVHFPGQGSPSRRDFVDLPLLAAGCVFAVTLLYRLAGGRVRHRDRRRSPGWYLAALAVVLALAVLALVVHRASS